MAEDTEITPLDFNVLDAVPHTYRLLASGGVAGCVAKTATAPLSRLTILFQVYTALPGGQYAAFERNIFKAMRKVLREEGFFAFWKGNGTSVMHRFPYTGINFLCYERIKEYLGDGAAANETPFIRLTAGACAGLIACSACYPLDLIRTRLTMQEGHQHYRGITDALVQISRKEGLGGLYRGLGTTLMVAVPNLAISYCIYGSMKEVLWQLKYPNGNVLDASREEPHFLDSMVCGATSGIISSLITYPVDVLRRRLQVRGLHAPPGDGHGPWSEAKTLFQREGIRGFYRGLAPELLKVTPMVGFTFGTYEAMKEFLGV